MDKKKKRELNIQIICSGLLVKGAGISFIYCLITGLLSWHLPILAVGLLFIVMEFEFLIMNNSYRIQKLEHQQKGEW